jgi:hypothetical protein
MICTITGRPPAKCKPSSTMYNGGCRCKGARRAAADAKADYRREHPMSAVFANRKYADNHSTRCPICGKRTYRDSGFCCGCEVRR